MNVKNRRTLITNTVKTVIAYLVTSVFGYILYRLFINGTNVQQPDGAAFRTVVFSIAIFVLFVYLSVRIHNLPTRDERKIDEIKELERLQTESGYELDYNAYYKDVLFEVHI